MSDPFKSYQRGLESPATHHLAITPSDAADLPVIPRVIYCATGGALRLRDRSGNDLDYSVTAGQILPISPLRVLASGTTATVYGWY